MAFGESRMYIERRKNMNDKKRSASFKVSVVLISLGILCCITSPILRCLEIIESWIFVLLLFLGAFYIFLGVVGYANDKNNRAKNNKRPENKELTPEIKEKYDKIIEYVKAKSSSVSYHIDEISKDEPITLTDSKFGGYPYWTANKEYPVDASGNKMYLLAQINFEQMAPEDDLLPKSGILQFFTADDDLCGANFEDPTDQKDFRVIYHSEIGEPLSVEQLREQGIKANIDLNYRESMLPSVFEDAIRFTKTVDYIYVDTEEFEEYVKEAMLELYGQTISGSLYDKLDKTEYYYLIEPFSTFGHKMLGIPAFTQYDPRIREAEVPEGKKANTIEHYDTLLFQMDSHGHIMWGDSGVANFFINSEDLKNLNFSDVLYNWDCY